MKVHYIVGQPFHDPKVSIDRASEINFGWKSIVDDYVDYRSLSKDEVHGALIISDRDDVGNPVAIWVKPDVATNYAERNDRNASGVFVDEEFPGFRIVTEAVE